MQNRFSDAQRQTMLETAAASIQHGLAYDEPLAVESKACAPALREKGATFVTLRLGGELQGCIGTLQAVRPLIADVAHNAYAAAFQDPRGGVLTDADLPRLEISISILSASEPLRFSSEEDLLSQIRPGVDGLILREGANRGTLLPSVWEALPDAKTFLRHLKLKAGLPGDYWSPTVNVARYTTEYFSNRG